MHFSASILLTLALLALAQTAHSADWSTTEMHFSNGDLNTPDFVADKTAKSANTTIITLQNASGWSLGNTFFFVDYVQDDNSDSFANRDFYGEFYASFSASKIFNTKIKWGPINDVSALMGINIGGNAKVRKYLPGIRLGWQVPGFSFLNTDFTAYIDDNAGAANGGAPSETDSFMIDTNWAYPLKIGKQSFSIVGHMEYIGSRTNEFNGKVSSWFLAQPQFRWDAGKTFFDREKQFYLGIEYQFWRNKLGDPNTHDSVAQLLAVWRF